MPTKCAIRIAMVGRHDFPSKVRPGARFCQACATEVVMRVFRLSDVSHRIDACPPMSLAGCGGCLWILPRHG